jgi:hypothetical protein
MAGPSRGKGRGGGSDVQTNPDPAAAWKGDLSGYRTAAQAWMQGSLGSPQVKGLSPLCDEFFIATRPDYVSPRVRPKGRSPGKGSGGGGKSGGGKRSAGGGKRGMFG